MMLLAFASSSSILGPPPSDIKSSSLMHLIRFLCHNDIEVSSATPHLLRSLQMTRTSMLVFLVCLLNIQFPFPLLSTVPRDNKKSLSSSLFSPSSQFDMLKPNLPRINPNSVCSVCGQEVCYHLLCFLLRCSVLLQTFLWHLFSSLPNRLEMCWSLHRIVHKRTPSPFLHPIASVCWRPDPSL